MIKKNIHLVVLLLLMSIVTIYQEIVYEESVDVIPEPCGTEINCQESRLSVTFKPSPVVVEQEIHVTIAFSPQWKLVNAWVEGVNMYMGKSPVIFDAVISEVGSYNGILFLGSCSEPQMHWRLATEWQTMEAENNQTVTLHHDFFTK